MQESVGSVGDAAERSAAEPAARNSWLLDVLDKSLHPSQVKPLEAHDRAVVATRLRMIRDLASEQAEAFELLGPRGENVASLVHLVRDLGWHARQGLADLGLDVDS